MTVYNLAVMVYDSAGRNSNYGELSDAKASTWTKTSSTCDLLSSLWFAGAVSRRRKGGGGVDRRRRTAALVLVGWLGLRKRRPCGDGCLLQARGGSLGVRAKPRSGVGAEWCSLDSSPVRRDCRIGMTGGARVLVAASGGRRRGPRWATRPVGLHRCA
jgi:hypothetical protein